MERDITQGMYNNADLRTFDFVILGGILCTLLL